MGELLFFCNESSSGLFTVVVVSQILSNLASALFERARCLRSRQLISPSSLAAPDTDGGGGQVEVIVGGGGGQAVFARHTLCRKQAGVVGLLRSCCRPFLATSLTSDYCWELT